MKIRQIARTLVLIVTPILLAETTTAADHGDTPLLKSIGRADARITDLHAFTRGDRLVLSLCTNPNIPVGATSYQYPSDLTLRIHIDRHSAVRFDNADDLKNYGGTIIKPDRIAEDILFEITFDKNGQPDIKAEGLTGRAAKEVKVFSGLRDDPFIRGPRIGRNVAAIVLEMPLAETVDRQPTLLIWATAKIPDIRGPISEHAGRALRSMFPENDALNTLRPRDHYKLLGVQPDVMIFDTSRPAAYPNGRDLADDVMDDVNDPRVMADDNPYPPTNDVPFLAEFPYLAPPH